MENQADTLSSGSNSERDLPLHNIPLHPFLFALYAIGSLLAFNLQEIEVSQAYRSVLFSILLVVATLGAFFLLIRNWKKAAALTSLIIILFFSYGHVYGLIKNAEIAGMILGRHRYLLLVFGVLLFLGAVYIFRGVKDFNYLTRNLNILAIILFAIPLLNITMTSVRTASRSLEEDSPPIPTSEDDIELENLPDIYYIILDSYARSDFMQSSFGYDNTGFLDHLEGKGFYIAEESNSNHNWTALSLSSSLNLEFVQNLGIPLVRGSYPGIFIEPIRHSRVRAILEDLGYSTVAFRTGYIPTEILDAEYFFEPNLSDFASLEDPLTINAFEAMLLHSTALVLMEGLESSPFFDNVAFRSEYSYSVLREIILSQFANVEQVPSIPGPKFVFLHVLAPHKPYLFGPDGEEIEQSEFFTLTENPGSDSDSSNDLYHDQAIYISKKVQTAVDTILDNSEIQPIIIIQSDTGPSAGIDWNDPEGPGVPQRTAILNAYLLPDACREDLYPSITPVNSFRLVLNCVFGAEVPLLEDHVYFSKWPRTAAYKFVPVDDRLEWPVEDGL
jgi:hypothetical protein